MSALLQRVKALPTLFYLAAVPVALSFLLPLPQRGSIAGLPSLCSFHNLTGLPCPGCGLTRSWVCLGHGHLTEAFVWHPLGPALWLFALVYAVLVWVQPNWKFQLLARWPLLAAFTATFLLFWVLRLEGVFPLPSS